MIRVRGAASAQELAAVLAVLRRPTSQPTPYERWRAGRLAALRRTALATAPPR